VVAGAGNRLVGDAGSAGASTSLLGGAVLVDGLGDFGPRVEGDCPNVTTGAPVDVVVPASRVFGASGDTLVGRFTDLVVSGIAVVVGSSVGRTKSSGVAGSGAVVPGAVVSAVVGTVGFGTVVGSSGGGSVESGADVVTGTVESMSTRVVLTSWRVVSGTLVSGTLVSTTKSVVGPPAPDTRLLGLSTARDVAASTATAHMATSVTGRRCANRR
jgi:hypothetical protein